MKLVCRLLGHRRSARYIREDYGFGWRSRCRFCGEAMIRATSAEWLLERHARNKPEFAARLGPTRLPFISKAIVPASAPMNLDAERARPIAPGEEGRTPNG